MQCIFQHDMPSMYAMLSGLSMCEQEIASKPVKIQLLIIKDLTDQTEKVEVRTTLRRGFDFRSDTSPQTIPVTPEHFQH